MRLERGGDGETDRLARTALIRDNKKRRQRIESALHTLDGRIERLEINRNIGTLLHGHPSFCIV